MKVTLSGGGTVTIDGRTLTGRHFSIEGDRVIVDGVVQGGSLVGPITVTVNGNAEQVETSSGNVDVSGSVGRLKTVSGDICCGDVTGDVSTTSGDIECGAITGNVRTVSGDIKGTAKR